MINEDGVIDDNDDMLIYQQLTTWLGDLALAKTAGQAGEQMTALQQSVLSRQLKMIEDIIASVQ